MIPLPTARRRRAARAPIVAACAIAALVAAFGPTWSARTAPASPAQPGWVPANGGSYGAAVYALARDPDRPAIRYAGGATGFARTVDSGATWTRLGDGLPPACQVLAVQPLREQPATLFAGCYGADYANGLYRSPDRGSHWLPSTTGMLPNMDAFALLEGPGTPGVLLAGMADGIYRSDDAGRSWARVLHGEGYTLSAYSLAHDPFSPLIYYAATSSNVYKSVDGGRSWFAANNGLGDLGSSAVNAVVADPTRRDRLFLATQDKGVYRSTDNGNSWQSVSAGPSHVYALLVQPLTAVPAGALTPDLTAHLRDQAAQAAKAAKASKGKKGKVPPSLPETALVLAGTDTGVQGSIDGGDSWVDRTQSANDALASGARPYPPLPPGDAVYALLSFGRSAEILAGGYPGGVFRSRDLARSWRSTGPGLPRTQAIEAIAVDPASPGVVYFGTAGGGVQSSTSSGGALSDRSVGLPSDAWVNDLLIQPARGDRLFAALGAPSGGVYVATGDRWSLAGLAGHFANTIVADPRDPNTLYAGLTHDGMGWSPDGGTTWRILGAGLPQAGAVLALAVDPHDALRILAGTDRGLYITTDQGDSWIGGGAGLPKGAITALIADPTVRHGFLAGTASGLYSSADGGATWSALGGVLDRATIYRLARDAADPRVLLAATNRGVFRSADRGRTWSALDAGFPGPSAAVAVAAAGPVAYAATDFGAFLLSPAGPVPPAAMPGGRYFPTFGHGIREPFLSFWRTHGGVAVFGFPRTEAIGVGGMMVQYFQRAVLEFSPVRRAVVLAPLGQIATRGRTFERSRPFPDGKLRIYIRQTRHSLAEPFLTFWRSHGGAAVFGNPISEVLNEENGDGTGRAYVLQYFQKARLEYHPENKGTSYEIQLGLLGEGLLRSKGWLQ